MTQQVGAHKVKVGTKFELLAKALLAVVLMSTSTLVLALDPYLIQPGDVLEISVWREDGLQREALVRPDGAFLKVNRALCVLLGYREDELLGVDVVSLTHRDDQPATQRVKQRVA